MVSCRFSKADGIKEEPAALHVHKMLSVTRRFRGGTFGIFHQQFGGRYGDVEPNMNQPYGLQQDGALNLSRFAGLW